MEVALISTARNQQKSVVLNSSDTTKITTADRSFECCMLQNRLKHRDSQAPCTSRCMPPKRYSFHPFQAKRPSDKATVL